jgi:hypothetical protein
MDVTASKTHLTYGAFIGLDQTNTAGFSGWILAGFKLRDMGRMPLVGVSNDGAITTPVSGQTSWLDYSGFYLKIGSGFDWGH